MAGILGKEEDQAWFREKAGKIYEAFNAAFFNHEIGHYIEDPAPEGLSDVSGKLNTAYGPVASAWKNEGNKVTCQISIPANTRGIFVFPAMQYGQHLYVDGVMVVEGSKVSDSYPDWIKSIDVESDPDNNQMVLGSGSYEIVISR